MRTLLTQLRVRLILGALAFLLVLTGAIILVVRDSLRFSARNMESLSREGILKQEQNSLLEITRREAELSDHAIHHNPADLTPLHQRLQNLDITSNSYAFILDENGRLVAHSRANAADQFEQSLLSTEATDLSAIVRAMRTGQSAVSQMEMAGDAVLVAYAPLEKTGWSLAVVTPVSDVTARAEDLSQNIERSVSDILRATLLTIGYFAIIVIIGIVLTARALTDPIQTLVAGTRSVATGDFSVHIPVKSSDELGVLAQSFNQMAGELLLRKNETEKINTALLKSEERFRLAIEAAPNAMVMGNESGQIVLANRQAETLFGYSQDELLGQPFEMLLPERFYELHAELRSDFLEEPVAHQMEAIRSVVGRRKDGGEFPAEVAYNPIETEEGILILASIVDISERQQLAEARIQAAVEERQRLARELHDSVTQSLYSLTLLAEASRRTAQHGEINKVVDNIVRLGETAQQALKEMRLLVYELRPLALETAGLVDALQHRLDAVEKRAGVDAQLQVELNNDLSSEVENTLYRIAQETLNNALKHAEATAVSVRLRSTDGMVEMEIRDNGKGFDPERIHDRGGLGITSIRERTEALGGKLSITSKPAEGTCIQIRLTTKK